MAKVFMVQVERSPVDDATNWIPDGEPIAVDGDNGLFDEVEAAFHVMRTRHLQPGRHRMVVNGRVFHPGTPL